MFYKNWDDTYGENKIFLKNKIWIVHFFAPIFILYNILHLSLTGLICKACSYEALTNHEWKRRSTDALNNNIRPKSELPEQYGGISSKNRKIPVTAFCLDEPPGVEGKRNMKFSIFS